MRNVITHFGTAVARIGFVCTMLIVVVSMMHGTVAAAGTQANSNSTPDYYGPADWNTYPVGGITPGVEPLNIIYSARSTVPLGGLLAVMKNWDDINCVSTEKADVASYGFIPQQASLRLEGCIQGGINLALTGAENHARLWNQPVSGSTFGAWFFTASYETSCIDTTAGLEPFNAVHNRITSGPWHCIDGGRGSHGSNGYDLGAANLATALVQAAHQKGWYAAIRSDSRPAGTGEDGVHFSSTVYVVTVDYFAPSYQGTGHNITYNITSGFALASVTEDQQGNISGDAL